MAGKKKCRSARYAAVSLPPMNSPLAVLPVRVDFDSYILVAKDPSIIDWLLRL